NPAEQSAQHPVHGWHAVAQPDGHWLRFCAERSLWFQRCASEREPTAAPIDRISDCRMQERQVNRQAAGGGAVKSDIVRDGALTVAKARDKSEEFFSSPHYRAAEIVACRTSQSGQIGGGQGHEPNRSIVVYCQIQFVHTSRED